MGQKQHFLGSKGDGRTNAQPRFIYKDGEMRATTVSVCISGDTKTCL